MLERDAEEKLEAAQEMYGSSFSAEINAWLADLVSTVAHSNDTQSVELTELLENLIATDARPWRASLSRWTGLPVRDKLRALLTVIKRHRPPWEIRVAARRLTLLGGLDTEVVVYFAVDHATRQVTVLGFEEPGLSGEDYGNNLNRNAGNLEGEQSVEAGVGALEDVSGPVLGGASELRSPSIPSAPGFLDSFLRGVGSVLEFFPPPERFDGWRAGRDVPINEWPMVVRGMLAEVEENASQREDHS